MGKSIENEHNGAKAMFISNVVWPLVRPFQHYCGCTPLQKFRHFCHHWCLHHHHQPGLHPLHGAAQETWVPVSPENKQIVDHLSSTLPPCVCMLVLRDIN